ncbi:MAG: ATP-binding protein [Promethearchaeota archaeon]
MTRENPNNNWLNPRDWLESRRNWAFHPDPRNDLVKNSNIFYYTEQHFVIWAEIRDLMLQPDSDTKKRGFVLEGPSHSGKTSLIQQFPAEYVLNTPHANADRILTYRIYGDNYSIKTQLADLGRFLKIPDIPNSDRKVYDMKPSVLARKVTDKLRRETDLLFVDEFERLYKHKDVSVGAILEVFHTIMDESGVPIIISGLDGVSELLSDLPRKYEWLEETFTTRFASVKMKALEYGREYVRLLKALHDDCKLEPENNPFYADKSLCEDILKITGGLLGKIIILIKESARYIYRNKMKHNPPISEDITFDLVEMIGNTLEKKKWKMDNGD